MSGYTRKRGTVDPDTLSAVVVAESDGAAEYIAKLRRQRAELAKVIEAFCNRIANADSSATFSPSARKIVMDTVNEMQDILAKVKQKTETK